MNPSADQSGGSGQRQPDVAPHPGGREPSEFEVRGGHAPISPARPAEIGRSAVETVPHIYYSATIITLDGSDTNAYGEGCEPGHGYTETFGWWSPDRDYWRVADHRDEVIPDIYPAGEHRSPARWLSEQLTARLGPIAARERYTFYGAYEAVYPGHLDEFVADSTAADPHWGHTVAAIRARLAPTGQRRLTAAGHAYGFTHGQLAEAAHLLRLS